MYHMVRANSEVAASQGGAVAPLLIIRKISLAGNYSRGHKRKASSIFPQQQSTSTVFPRQIRKVFVNPAQNASVSAKRQPSSGVRQNSSSQFYRSDFANQPFTGTYEPGLPTKGPLGSTSNYGAARLTPRSLKNHLDEFVVGQEQAKRLLSLAVHNHYLRVQEIQRREEEEAELLIQRLRRESHPVEDDFPGQQSTTRRGESANGPENTMNASLIDNIPLTLEKSNVLVLGPSGVGKTLIAKSLARILSVPISISDCTPFTQAGYIGDDVDVCVHRLLAAADYDVSQAERGIICLDEVDKIAASPRTHGKDVGGEGVQQALLKIIEGTTVQVTAKNERSASKTGGQPNSHPTSSSLGSPLGSSTPPQKGEVYNVRTDNILFICSGAFTGLQKVIMDRISKGSMGFGKPVKSSSGLSSLLSAGKSFDPVNQSVPQPVLPGSEEEELYRKNVPFFSPTMQTDATETGVEYPIFNPLDLVTEGDLLRFGFIPEIIGRIPTRVALSPLTHSLLLRILTEPRNSLLAQYNHIFQLQGAELRITTPALHIIASRALAESTGARALRTQMDSLLAEAMFDVPGTSIKHILVTERVAKRDERVLYFRRGQQRDFQSLIAAEEGDWEDRKSAWKEQAQARSHGSFEEWRGKASAAGAG